MGRLGCTKGKQGFLTEASTNGKLLVVLTGQPLDRELVLLGCWLAKREKRAAHLVQVIVVPRTLALNARQDTVASEWALQQALDLAHHVGCDASAATVHTRDVGVALVEEAKEAGCALLLLGATHQPQKWEPGSPRKDIATVLANAPCRVLFIQHVEP